MSKPLHEFDELDELLAMIWEQGLDPQRCQRLSDLLDGDPRAQRRYLEHQLLHANLMDSAGPLKAGHVAGDQLPAGLVEQGELDWIVQLETGFQLDQAGRDGGTLDPDRVTSRQLLSLTGYLLGRGLTSKAAIKTYATAAVLLLAVTIFFVFRDADDPTAD